MIDTSRWLAGVRTDKVLLNLLIQSQHDLLCAADLLAERRSQRRTQRKRKSGGAIA
jgi:hypothetical protein